MNLEFVQSNRGKQLAVFNNYVYRKDRQYKDTLFWKCVKYDSVKCSGRLHSVGNVVKKEVEHSHAPNPADVSARRIVEEVKRTARDTTENPQNIVANVCSDVPAVVISQLPEFANMKRLVRLERNRLGHASVNPTSLEDLIISDDYAQINGKPFLLYDNASDGDRILIFTTQENLFFLTRNPHWYCDGTFKAAPALFSQVYTIHAIEGNVTVPTVFALLSNRTQIIYEKLFSALKHLKPELSPKTIMTDFERASLKAISSVFPEARQTGCFFHFKQCLFRKIQANTELYQKYKTEPAVSMELNKLGALAFIPVDDVSFAYEEILKTAFYSANQDSLADILDYMESVWVGKMMRGGRRKSPLYSLEIWNQHVNAREGLHKTNNCVESWHNSFNKLLGSCHPTVWKIIDAFKKEQTLTEIKVVQLRSGHIKQRKKVVVTKEKRIQSVLENYHKERVMETINGICYNILD